MGLLITILVIVIIVFIYKESRIDRIECYNNAYLKYQACMESGMQVPAKVQKLVSKGVKFRDTNDYLLFKKDEDNDIELWINADYRYESIRLRTSKLMPEGKSYYFMESSETAAGPYRYWICYISPEDYEKLKSEGKIVLKGVK